MPEQESKQAGTIALICSFLFPIVGIILYFVKKNDVENASAYLYCALAAVIIGSILRWVL